MAQVASSASPTPAVHSSNNVELQIDNPLKHVHPESKLEELAKRWAQRVDEACPTVRDTLCPKHGNNPCPDDAKVSPNKTLFSTAVKIAYDHPNRRSVLAPEDIRTLEKGRAASTFWRQPKALQATVVSLCLSAVIQGFCQSVLNGANQTLPEEFDLEERTWIFACLNAIVYLTAGIFGCWVSDPLQWMYSGRKGAILAAAFLCLASVIGGAFTQNWQQLMVCRALLGIGLGAKASITPLLCAEASPSHLRGALVINWQLFDAFGIWLGFSANLALAPTGRISWRLQTASACIPTICLIMLIWCVPESPRWLLKQGKYSKAFSAMCALRHSPLQAATELVYANAQLQPEIERRPLTSEESGAVLSDQVFQDAAKNSNYWLRILQLFRDPRTRRATVAAGVVMIGQQLCGINVLAFYSTTFFRDFDGVSARSALWLSWGVGLANFSFAILAYFWIDRKGRRFLLLATYPGMIVCMFGACLSFLRNDTVTPDLVYTFLFLFVLFYSVGQGPVAWAYASEVFPLLYREAGMSFSVFINLTGAGILTLLVPQAQTPRNEGDLSDDKWTLRQTRLLAAFTVFNVLSFTMIFFLVPETAGKARAIVRNDEDRLNYISLEELQYIFKQKTSVHINRYIRSISTAWKKLTDRTSRKKSTDRDNELESIHESIQEENGRRTLAATIEANQERSQTSNYETANEPGERSCRAQSRSPKTPYGRIAQPEDSSDVVQLDNPIESSGEREALCETSDPSASHTAQLQHIEESVGTIMGRDARVVELLHQAVALLGSEPKSS